MSYSWDRVKFTSTTHIECDNESHTIAWWHRKSRGSGVAIKNIIIASSKVQIKNFGNGQTCWSWGALFRFRFYLKRLTLTRFSAECAMLNGPWKNVWKCPAWLIHDHSSIMHDNPFVDFKYLTRRASEYGYHSGHIEFEDSNIAAGWKLREYRCGLISGISV